MKLKETAKNINEYIRKWSEGKQKLVVAVDGYTGVGKTTILDALAELNSDILPVHCDDFMLSAAEFKKILALNEDRSVTFELHRNDYGKIEDMVNAFRKRNDTVELHVANRETGKTDVTKTFELSKSIMVIEGVFMFHPKLLDHLWDKRIYLDGDTVTIDERRVKREKERWGDKYFPETHPDLLCRKHPVSPRYA
ncbi:MAG: hypothetical protein A2942_02340 [Candidatus Lloydbacteria bacterium RIFCSPLOWO2_01_FULL_50_20]|uniref:Phosphoribulokinase/uridine kinase domain-containing protein n=1 Tax=Candidatus Lloydbacteria bacterium RIFCSPLOWO2_01_FULL_50_20 TaxID=1798665 RepID=A0A1G2DK75_9BACT|nr:MAG: hypothetical protein A2942_02340 [Candidatus Lloydbacteria bacterium RIFCSPLOWO2_01_FULL_50_20]